MKATGGALQAKGDRKGCQKHPPRHVQEQHEGLLQPSVIGEEDSSIHGATFQSIMKRSLGQP